MKKFSKRSFLKALRVCFVAALLTATALLGACNLSGGKKEGTLVIWWPGGSQAEKAALYEAKDKYIAGNDGVTINIIEKTTSQFYSDYMMATNGNDYPDICYVDHVFVQQLAYDKIIANLSACDAEIDTVIKGKIIDSLWAPNQYEGKTYALPVSANTMALVYNRAILKPAYQKKGLTWSEADVPATWTELMAACQIVKEYSDSLPAGQEIIPYTFPAGSGSNNNSMAGLQFLSYVAREGGTLMSSDLKTMNLRSNPVKAAAEKIYSLRSGAGGQGYSSKTFEEGKFEAGNVAFIEMGPWKMNTYNLLAQESTKCDYGWAPNVKFSQNGSNVSPLGLFSMVATNKSVNRNLAIDFMKFFVSDDALMLSQNTPQNLISPLKSTRTNEFYTTGDIWPVYLAQIDSVVARPGTPIWGTIEVYIGEFVTNLLSGSRTPDYLDDINYTLQNSLDEMYSGGF